MPQERQTDPVGFRRWYAARSRQLGLDPNPDNPLHFYDYRAAFRAGADAQVIPEDGLAHFPSEFKKIGHPNLIVDGRDTRTGEIATAGLFRQNRAANARALEDPRLGKKLQRTLGVGAPR